jgi:hypothetical protein
LFQNTLELKLMTNTPDPGQITSHYSSLRRRYDQLHGDATLTDIVSGMSTTTNTVVGLPDDIAKIRSRGYAFASYLEQKAEVLGKQWRDVRRNVERAVETEAENLRRDIDQVRILVEQADKITSNPTVLGNRLPGIERELTDAETKLNAAKSRIKETYSALEQDISGATRQLSDINWYLDQRDEASFPFLAGETLFLAAKAEWVQTGKGGQDPDGILYLTSQRLVFEQKETTGKTLGLFGGKKTQELEWDIPLNQIEKVEAENKGFFGGKDMLYFTLGSGAKFDKITVEVKGGVACKFWAAQIGRMMTGGVNDERAIQPDAEMLESLRKAPTACHVCAATLPQITAGQLQIDCLYCGTVIRL